MDINRLEQFIASYRASAAELETFREEIEAQGYTAFREWMDAFTERIKHFTDAEAPDMERWLNAASELFPEPGKFSPSWNQVWDELKQITACKSNLLQKIAPAERDGEWQVLLDNPYTNREIVCYPALSFMEAAYLFAYFRPTLEKNEYVRLQKIVQVYKETGESQPAHQLTN